ncbi:MAG: hypothetical protein M3R02_17050 [Chloroflexota bacterium]|nr:hypothetical protein [Chloroflexota bacterium]
MTEFFTSIPNTLLGWLGILLALAFAVVKFFDQRNAQSDKERDDLIDILQQRLKLLETIVAEVEKLKAENEVLKSVVLGKDSESQELRNKAMKAIDQIEFLYEQRINDMKERNLEEYVTRPRRRQKDDEDRR